MAHVKNNGGGIFSCGQTELPYAVVAAWAYKSNNGKLALELASHTYGSKFDLVALKHWMGYMYYDDMLGAYTYSRDYGKAIMYCNHLAGKAFKGFEYRKNAIRLAKQLRSRAADYRSFTLPDSTKWHQLKTVMTRSEQLTYLLDRLHLLNCIQTSQPGDIYYADDQCAIPFDSLYKLSGYAAVNIGRFPAINPYVAIIAMKPSPAEMELLVPGLLDSSYIPAYSFHRNFKCERTLHKYAWVIEDIIFQISNKHFITDRSNFDGLNFARKKGEVEDILAWCRASKGLSEKELLHKVLIESQSWDEFGKALKISIDNRDSSITSILPLRLGSNSFADWSTPSNVGTIAKAMFGMSSGSESDKQAVLKWRAKTADPFVQLWSLLFLLKFDTANLDVHFTALTAILKNCDSQSVFYPYAMGVLLLHNDLKIRKLAEGTLNSMHLASMLRGIRHEETLKLFVIKGCDTAFEWLYKGLNDFEEDTTFAMFIDGEKVTQLQCEQFVFAVYTWRDGDYEYKQEWPMQRKKKYAHDLSVWLKQQYELIKKGEESAIKLDNYRLEFEGF